jgi:uncharacterized alpha-E superfamily protein
MLSRVADSFYWLSRYLERAEHSARVLNVHLSLTLDDPTDRVGRSLLAAIGHAPPDTTPTPGADPSIGRADPRHRAGVAACVVGARENARQIREQISSEMWEQLNRMYLLVREAEQSETGMEAGSFLRAVIEGAQLFRGVTEATLSRSEGWQYLQLGRFIERATATAGMLEEYFNDAAMLAEDERAVGRYENALGVLRACAAFEPYCRHYTADFRSERVAEFLLLNGDVPRSVRFAVERVEDALADIAQSQGRQAAGRPQRMAGQLRAALEYGQIDEIMAASLTRYVQGIRTQCDHVHAAIYQTYINYPIETALAR